MPRYGRFLEPSLLAGEHVVEDSQTGERVIGRVVALPNGVLGFAQMAGDDPSLLSEQAVAEQHAEQARRVRPADAEDMTEEELAASATARGGEPGIGVPGGPGDPSRKQTRRVRTTEVVEPAP